MEAFDDNDFIFSCLNNNPETSINTNPINYSVWRTNNNWEFTHFYLPLNKAIQNSMGNHGILLAVIIVLYFMH